MNDHILLALRSFDELLSELVNEVAFLRCASDYNLIIGNIFAIMASELVSSTFIYTRLESIRLY
jgi:hypothetical protein